MKYLILGCGLQGRVIAYDILKFDPGSFVTIADIDDNNLAIAKDLIKDTGLSVEKIDVFNISETAGIMADADVIVNSLPHNWDTTKAFYDSLTKVKGKKAILTDYWLWEKHYEFDEILKKADSLVIPGLGIEPGFGNICGGQLAYEFDELFEFYIYVGGIPAERGRAPMDYMILFNVEALLDMCLTPPVVIRDGNLAVEKPLSVSEKFLIPGYGEMEAFITDGLFSLCKTLREKGVKNACEYTLRHPGFCKSLEVFKDAGFFSKEPVVIDGASVRPLDVSEAVLSKLMVKDPDIPDITYLYAVGKGRKDGKYTQKSYELIAKSDDSAGITSMEIATAYPSSIAAIIAAHDNGGARGVVEPECFFIGDKFHLMVEELAKRGIFVSEK